jgi:Domain of unknown function (DUF4296)
MRSSAIISSNLYRSSGELIRRRTEVNIIVLTLLLITGSFISSGCASGPKSASVIPDSTLVLILADLYVVDAAATLEQDDVSEIADSSILSGIVPASRDQVFDKHGVTDSEFEESMRPFVDDPARYVALYNQVLDRLNLIQRRPTPAADTSDVSSQK